MRTSLVISTDVPTCGRFIHLYPPKVVLLFGSNYRTLKLTTTTTQYKLAPFIRQVGSVGESKTGEIYLQVKEEYSLALEQLAGRSNLSINALLNHILDDYLAEVY